MDSLVVTTHDPTAPSEANLDFEGRRAFAAVMSRLTGRSAGLRVGRYEVREPLGEGGFATVYAGHDPQLDRRVAIKVMRASRSSDEHSAQERMIREAQALAQLRHPNVVQIFDVGFHETDEGHRSIHIVMELLEGPTLAQWQAKPHRSLAAIVGAYAQAGAALAAAHEVGVIHRDFKPTNAMFAADGRLKVLDFGLACVDGVVSQDTEQLPDLSPVSLTRTGIVMGTPRYMAPEQHRSEPSTERSDQYALCVALWEAITGEPPFAGTTIVELAVEKRMGPPPRPRAIPAPLYRALARGLQTKATARFSSMAALVQALRSRDGTRWWLAGVGAALAASVAGVAGVAAKPAAVPPICDAPVPQWTSRFGNAVERTTPPRTSERWGVQEKIRTRLLRFDSEWSSTRDQICAPARAPTQEARVTADCLARGGQYFTGLLDQIESTTGLPSQRTYRQLLGLPVPVRCLSGDAKSLYVSDPEREAKLDHYEATAKHWIAMEAPVGADALDAGLAEAQRLGDHWVTTRILLGRSMQMFMAGRPSDAAEELRQATWHAEAMGDPLLGAELLPGTIGHGIDSGASPAELDKLIARGNELIAAAGQPLSPRIQLLAVQATAETRRSEYGKATELATLALELAGETPPPGAEYAVALALVVLHSLRAPDPSTSADIEAGLTRVLAMGGDHDRWYGSTAAIAHAGLSDLKFNRGDIAGAVQHTLELCRQIGRVSPEPTAALMYGVARYGRLLVFQGADALGMANMQTAYDWIRDTQGSLDFKLALIASEAVDASFELGRPDEALVWAKRQLDHVERQYGVGHLEAVWPQAAIARALAQLGRTDEAEVAMAAAFLLGDQDPEDTRSVLFEVRGEIDLAAGRYAAARDDLLIALENFGPDLQSPFDRGERGDLYLTMAAAMRGLGDDASADIAEQWAIEALAGGSESHRRRAARVRASRVLAETPAG